MIIKKMHQILLFFFMACLTMPISSYWDDYSSYTDYFSDSRGLRNMERVFDHAFSDIRYGNINSLKDHLRYNKGHVCEDGRSFADQLLWYCLIEARLEKGFQGVEFKNIIKSAECIIKHGGNYKHFINELLDIDEYRASRFLTLFLDSGLTKGKKTIIKIVKHAVKKKKKDLLQVIADYKISLPRSLRKKVRRLLQGKNHIVSHAKLLRELKAYFRKRNKNKNKKTGKKGDCKALTQTEAFLNVWFKKKKGVKDYDALIRRMLQKEYSDSGWWGSLISSLFRDEDLDLYTQLVSSMLEKEREHSDCYVFYHAHSTNTGFVFDVQTAIVKWLQLEMNRYKDVYMRFNTMVTQDTLKDFMQYHDTSYCGWNDHLEPLRSQVLCVNYAIFGNTGDWGECSLYYFIQGQSISDPSHVVYTLFQDLGFSEKYIDTLHDLYNQYMVPDKGGQMLQIFIPKDKVDDFVYLSKAGGVPYKCKIEGIPYNKKKRRHTHISPFLKQYVSNPFSLKTEDYKAKDLMNTIQGRIVFMPHFYDPSSGIKIVRYNFIPKEQKKIYAQKFEEVIDQMMGQWIDTQGYENMQENKQNRRLLRLLRYMKQGCSFDKSKA